MVKEDYRLVENDLFSLEENYTRYDIVNMIELSFQFAEKKINLDREILEDAFDTINTWGLFVKFCYDELIKEKREDFFDYTEEEIQEIMTKFKEKYYNKEVK